MDPTVRTVAQAGYLAVQSVRALNLRDALTLLEADLATDPEARHGTTHEVVQRALRQASELAEALEREAKVLGGVR